LSHVVLEDALRSLSWNKALPSELQSVHVRIPKEYSTLSQH
jgi:hypothetical protein